MKRKLSYLLSAVLIIGVLAMAACTGGGSTDSGGGPSTDSGSTSSGDSGATTAIEEKGDIFAGVEKTVPADQQLKIAYCSLTNAMQWMQNVIHYMTLLGERPDYNFELLVSDSDFSAETQLSQVSDMIALGIDGITTCIADESIGPAMAQLCADAGIPLVGESLMLIDSEGNPVAPYSELDAYACGQMATNWIADNHERLGFDLSDLSKVGFICVTDSMRTVDMIRVEGAIAAIKDLYTDFQDDNIFIADVAGDPAALAEAAYNQTAAITNARPDIETWLVVGVNEDFAIGACRSIEDGNLVNKTILVSLGGERVVPAWEGGTREPWYACVYFTAEDDANLVIGAMMDILRNGVPVTDIFAENKEPGQLYAKSHFYGQMITWDNYLDVVDMSIF